jgi:uncharacterized damage-inducible protein DinB
MNWIKILQDEWNHELANTKKILLALPSNFDWKPHEKSMSLGRLATHVAEIAEWMYVTLETKELDFSKGYNPNVCATPADVLALFEKMSAKSVDAIQKMTEETLQENWTLRNGEQVYFTMPKFLVLRQFVISHLVHHRAQLGVYIRMQNVPLPGTYGPSADES